MLPLAVTAAAALTAVGDGVDQTCSSIRAGIKGFKAHAFFQPAVREEQDERQPLIAAPAPGIDPARAAAPRLVDLLLPVLSELMERGHVERRQLAEHALLVALPEPDEATAKWNLEKEFLPELTARSGLAFKHVAVNRTGRAGMLELLADAANLFAERTMQRAIVAGVDSYLTADRLAYLDRTQRLKSPRNVDGFIPGEAASALLVVPASRLSPRGPPALATVTASGRGLEPQPFTSERQSTGRGLCEALRTAQGGPAACVLCDLNGESYRSFEWGLALARAGDLLGNIERLVHPAINHGDIGAASGGVLAAAAIAGFTRGYAPAGDALLFATSDGPARAAARLVRP